MASIERSALQYIVRSNKSSDWKLISLLVMLSKEGKPCPEALAFASGLSFDRVMRALCE